VSREIIEHGKAAVALPNDARCGAVMLVLARVGLSIALDQPDPSRWIGLGTECASSGEHRRDRHHAAENGVSDRPWAWWRMKS
jgi:hypothetical protein